MQPLGIAPLLIPMQLRGNVLFGHWRLVYLSAFIPLVDPNERRSIMALFKFRTRSPQRDHDTDVARLSRLQAFLDDLQAEMERERNGLRDRYEKVTTRAAFSQQALEDEVVAPRMSSTIDDLTETMIRYTDRLASLEKQIAFVTETRTRVDLFSQQNEAIAGPAGNSDKRPA